MNNWNPLEKQLRSWTPRAPSAKLKAQLFAKPAAENGLALAQATATSNSSAETPPFSWQWFAPSTALVLIATFLLGNHGGVLGLTSAATPGMIASAALREPDLSTYYVSARHSENNTPVVGVEWTNGTFAQRGAPTNQLNH